MATWFTITYEGDPTEDDYARVAELAAEGCTSGQLINDEDRHSQSGDAVRITGGVWGGHTGHVEHVCKNGSRRVRLDALAGLRGKLITLPLGYLQYIPKESE